MEALGYHDTFEPAGHQVTSDDRTKPSSFQMLTPAKILDPVTRSWILTPRSLSRSPPHRLQGLKNNKSETFLRRATLNVLSPSPNPFELFPEHCFHPQHAFGKCPRSQPNGEFQSAVGRRKPAFLGFLRRILLPGSPRQFTARRVIVWFISSPSVHALGGDTAEKDPWGARHDVVRP